MQNMFNVNNNYTWMKSIPPENIRKSLVFWYFQWLYRDVISVSLLSILNIFSVVSIVEFEHVIVCWLTQFCAWKAAE